MIIKLLYPVILFLSLAGALWAQNDEIPDISADRPGVATPVVIVLPHKFQIETGSSFERSNAADNYFENIYFNSSLLRFGINPNAEIRIQTDFLMARIQNSKAIGLNPLTIGTKVMIYYGNRILPATSVLLNLTMPCIGKNEFRPNHLSPAFYVLMQKDITPKLNLCLNFGAKYDDLNTVADELFALSFGYSITEKFSAFIESYNYFAPGWQPYNGFDLGFAYVIGKNIQLDLSENMNFQDLNNYYMINFGFSWRIMKKYRSTLKMH
jgi:hypothetical protein